MRADRAPHRARGRPARDPVQHYSVADKATLPVRAGEVSRERPAPDLLAQDWPAQGWSARASAARDPPADPMPEQARRPHTGPKEQLQSRVLTVLSSRRYGADLLLECASMRLRATILIAMMLMFAFGAASADTIHLKNGRTILVDHVRENGNRYEYEIGDDTYAIPKNSVDRIEAGGLPAHAASSGGK